MQIIDFTSLNRLMLNYSLLLVLLSVVIDCKAHNLCFYHIVNNNELNFRNVSEEFILSCLKNFGFLEVLRIRECNISTFFDQITEANLLGIKRMEFKQIDISQSFLTRVNITDIFHLSNVSQLSIVDSNLSSFTCSIKWESLTNLTLSGNKLTYFLGIKLLPNLETLDLSHNSFLVHIYILGTDKLTLLNLSYLENGAIMNLTISNSSISRIDLSYSRLETVSRIHFPGVVRIGMLRVPNNKLRSLDSLLNLHNRSSNSQIEVVDVDNNPFCCSMNLTKDWLKLISQTKLFNAHIYCSFPGKQDIEYSVARYGLMLDNESKAHECLTTTNYLTAYIMLEKIKFVLVIDTGEDVQLKWTSKERPISDFNISITVKTKAGVTSCSANKSATLSGSSGFIPISCKNREIYLLYIQPMKAASSLISGPHLVLPLSVNTEAPIYVPLWVVVFLGVFLLFYVAISAFALYRSSRKLDSLTNITPTSRPSETSTHSNKYELDTEPITITARLPMVHETSFVNKTPRGSLPQAPSVSPDKPKYSGDVYINMDNGQNYLSNNRLSYDNNVYEL